MNVTFFVIHAWGTDSRNGKIYHPPPTVWANLSDLARRANLITIFVFLTFFSSFRIIAQRENSFSHFSEKINFDLLSFKVFHFKWGKFRNWISVIEISRVFLINHYLFRHGSNQKTKTTVWDSSARGPLSFLDEENEAWNRHKNELCTYTMSFQK